MTIIPAAARPVITTVTLNPAIDQALSIDEITLGGGGTNRCQLDTIDPAGKGLNASRVISRLGRKTRALGFVARLLDRVVVDSLP